MSRATFAFTSAGLGAGLWTWLLLTRFLTPDAPGSLSGLNYPSVRLILLLNALVITPLILPLVRVIRRDGGDSLLFRALVYFQAPAALCLVLSLTRDMGGVSAWLSLPWLVFTLLMALYGLQRFLPRNTDRGPGRFSELCLDAGLLYLPTGSVWLTAFQFNVNLLGFNDTWVILTAAHFHYAAFAAPVWAGLTGRALAACEGLTEGPRKIYFISTLIIIPGPLLTALGITFSPILEAFAAASLALALGALALLNLFIIARRYPAGGPRRMLAGSLLGFSSAALIFGMCLAVLFALGRLTGKPLFEGLTIAFMIRFHGWMNSAFFALPAIFAYAILRPPYIGAAPSPPFSRFKAFGPVGGDFFERNDLLDEKKPAARGLVDDLDSLAGLDFEPNRLHPLIRAFYEQTDRFELLVVPRWQKGFRGAARLYKLLSSRMGQMNFPVHAESPEDLMDSRILSLSDEKDGRANVRAWVRVYESTGKPIYAAAYSSHGYRERVYMNIAFPHILGNMTSLLRLESWPGEGESTGWVELSTLPPRLEGSRLGDEGIYYVTGLTPIRLPFDERIRVWAREDPETPARLARSDYTDALMSRPEIYRRAVLVAEHDMWLFGYKFLTLDYYIHRDRE